MSKSPEAAARKEQELLDKWLDEHPFAATICPKCGHRWTELDEDDRICRLIEEKAELVAIRDQARAVHATGAGTYNDKRTSVDRKKLSDLGLMVKESYKTIPSEFNGSEKEK